MGELELLNRVSPWLVTGQAPLRIRPLALHHIVDILEGGGHDAIFLATRAVAVLAEHPRTSGMVPGSVSPLCFWVALVLGRLVARPIDLQQIAA